MIFPKDRLGQQLLTSLKCAASVHVLIRQVPGLQDGGALGPAPRPSPAPCRWPVHPGFSPEPRSLLSQSSRGSTGQWPRHPRGGRRPRTPSPASSPSRGHLAGAASAGPSWEEDPLPLGGHKGVGGSRVGPTRCCRPDVPVPGRRWCHRASPWHRAAGTGAHSGATAGEGACRAPKQRRLHCRPHGQPGGPRPASLGCELSGLPVDHLLAGS